MYNMRNRGGVARPLSSFYLFYYLFILASGLWHNGGTFKSLSFRKTAFGLLVRQIKILMPANSGHTNILMWLKCSKDVKEKKHTHRALKLEGFPRLILAAHFICSHMGDVLRVPAAFAGVWAEWMATSSIDLQRGPQIKPQDKRLGRRTMEEHSGPHGKRMTTGRSGRPQPTTVALVPGGKRPHNTRQEWLVNQLQRRNEVVHCGGERNEFFQEKNIHRNNTDYCSTFTIIFIASLRQSPSSSSLFPHLSPTRPRRPQTMKKVNMCTR